MQSVSSNTTIGAYQPSKKRYKAYTTDMINVNTYKNFKIISNTMVIITITK